MTGQKLASILEPHELNARVVFDTVYHPIETPLIRAAREKGIAVISGVEMFVQQGARQFEIWTGKPAPEDEMMRVVLHALKRRAEASMNGAGGKGAQVIPISAPRTAATAASPPSEPVQEPAKPRPQTVPLVSPVSSAASIRKAVPAVSPTERAVEPPRKGILKSPGSAKAAPPVKVQNTATAPKDARSRQDAPSRPASTKHASLKNGAGVKAAAHVKNGAGTHAARKSAAAPAIVRKVKGPAAHTAGKPSNGLPSRKAPTLIKKATAVSAHARSAKKSIAAAGRKAAPSRTKPRSKR